MKMSTLAQRVEEAIGAQFPRDSIEQVAGLLSQYGEHPHEREVERVQLDILELCDSNIEKVKHFVGAAKLDHRDIIFWAEYELIDGRLVLKPGFQPEQNERLAWR
jgi:hypothetical protein